MRSHITVFIICIASLSMPTAGSGKTITQPRQQSAMDQKYEGTVMLSGDAWIIQVRDGSGTIDFLPLNLKDAYKIEGLKVIFSAEMVSPPDDVRLVGKPIKITAIKKA